MHMVPTIQTNGTCPTSAHGAAHRTICRTRCMSAKYPPLYTRRPSSPSPTRDSQHHARGFNQGRRRPPSLPLPLPPASESRRTLYPFAAAPAASCIPRQRQDEFARRYQRHVRAVREPDRAWRLATEQRKVPETRRGDRRDRGTSPSPLSFADSVSEGPI